MMRPAFHFRPLATVSLFALGLAACTGLNPNANGPAGPSLYERIGGKPALVATVDDFFATVSSDPRIARRFAGVANDHFKAALVEQLCATTGGPCKYTGPSMKDAHAAMGISDAEFNAMIQDLRKSMGRQGISVDNQVAFASAVEPLRDDIVSPLPPTASVVTTPSGRRIAGPAPHSGPIHHVATGKLPPKTPTTGKKTPTTRHTTPAKQPGLPTPPPPPPTTSQ